MTDWYESIDFATMPTETTKEDVPVDKHLIIVLLQHLEYSLSDVGWDFNQLTGAEKVLLKDQETLDQLKALTTRTLGKPLIEIFKEEEDDVQFPLFV